jgi:hypothetical protein
LAANWTMLAEEWRWAGGKDLKINDLILCAGAGPVEYWALAAAHSTRSILIQHPDDQLCPMNWHAIRQCNALTGWQFVEVLTPHKWLATAILGTNLHGYGELLEDFHDSGFSDDGHVLPTQLMSLIHTRNHSTGAVLERHLRNAMTAVVSETLSKSMPNGVTVPVDGSWPPQLIADLMGAIGGHRMEAHLLSPARRLSEALSRNLARGDSAFIHPWETITRLLPASRVTSPALQN